LNFVGLSDALLNDGRWFEQYADFLKALGDLDDKLSIIDVVLTHVAVAQIDAALKVRIIRRHVVGADQVVDARTRTAYRCDHIIARLQFRHVRTDSFDLAKTFVTDHQKIVALRGLPILCRIDFLVGAVNANTQDFD
jgi:hypothetical protein